MEHGVSDMALAAGTQVPGACKEPAPQLLGLSGFPWVRTGVSLQGQPRESVLPTGFRAGPLGGPEANAVPQPMASSCTHTSPRGDPGAVTQAEGDVRRPGGPGAAQGPEAS